jgi:hypothetical protein
MKKTLLCTLMLGALASSGLAILQIDVPASYFPVGHDGYVDSFDGPLDPNNGPFAAVMNTMDGVARPATRIVGPDGFPLAYHLIFDYDDAPPPVPVVTTVSMPAGECTRVWTPLSFSVLYSPGPNFPIAWGFNGAVTPDNEPFSVDCWPTVPPCEYSCMADPAFLEFGEVTTADPVAMSFMVCNTSVGDDCEPITGTISENCDAMIVDPVDYALATGECIEITVTFAPDIAGEFTCEIITGCGSVVAHGIYTPVVDANDLPAVFALAEAYPNPFNPSTTIAYSVPETQEVTLSVFNTNGQLVKTLVSGMVERGAHKVVFDASSLSSGVYVYTLQTANQTAMNKMVLVK